MYYLLLHMMCKRMVSTHITCDTLLTSPHQDLLLVDTHKMREEIHPVSTYAQDTHTLCNVSSCVQYIRFRHARIHAMMVMMCSYDGMYTMIYHGIPVK